MRTIRMLRLPRTPVGCTFICQIMVIITMVMANITITTVFHGTMATAITTRRATRSFAMIQSRPHLIAIRTPCISTMA